MDEIEQQKMFFHRICTPKEIERIFNVKNADDILLKLRAETIVDHMRLYRVYLNKAMAKPDDWSLEESFDGSHYRAWIESLDENSQKQCKSLAYGDIFSNEPNGEIFPSNYGPIITINTALQFFLKFMHLALLGFESEVPLYVRLNAMRISVRVMLMTETLDFLMDPRGILPKDVAEAIHRPIPAQMKFIAGHEFAHFLLGHLKGSSIHVRPVLYAIKGEEPSKPMRVYNPIQKEELAADLASIRRPEFDPTQVDEMLSAATIWFGCLELYEAAHDVLYPQRGMTILSHPSASERLGHLSGEFPDQFRKWSNEIAQQKETIARLKEYLLKDISLSPETYETYGSVYLDKPNSDWRGPELKDRVDYY